VLMAQDRRPKKRGRPKDPGSKRSRGVDRHAQPRMVFHLEEELLEAVKDYCAAQTVPPDRSDVARVALRQFLERAGFWPRKGGE
jgi:hypothetical protein